MNIQDYKGVFVFIEQRKGEVQKVSLELLGKGRELADLTNSDLIAAIVGDDVAGFAPELVALGADKVIVAEHELLDDYVTETYTKTLCEILEEEKAEIVLMGATSIGRDLAPRVSARLHTGLTADCTSLEIDEDKGHLLMTRPAFGGNLMATIICPDHRPQMSTVRPGVMLMPEKDENRVGEIKKITPFLHAADVNIEILEEVKEVAQKVNIEDAKILISGGRGMGGKENFAVLEDFAEKIGGLVSGSRAVVDAGWLDRNRQVGQTGKTVRPHLYFACGISGAIQHVAGMEESELIVAINKNSSAPIFNVADLGIVGDAGEIIPALRDRLAAEITGEKLTNNK